MELRFIMRDGKKILQQSTGYVVDNNGVITGEVLDWQDVPLVEE